MDDILIFGSSGFVGKNLLNKIRASQGISVREIGWENKIFSSDILLNCIGKAHDHKGTATYEDYHFANVEILQQIYKAFINSEAQLLIHISSIAAQQELESNAPLLETDACVPISHYGKTKREAEEWLLNQHLPTGKKVIILRPPMIHGPGDKGNLKLLFKLISSGIPYPLSGFKNSRSFLCIDNFNFYMDQIMTHHHLLESGIYNLSDDESVSTQQIINIICNITGRKPVTISLPKKAVEFVARIGDTLPLPINSTRLKKLTGTLMVSNLKIKTALHIEKMPLTAEQGIIKTIHSFTKK